MTKMNIRWGIIGCGDVTEKKSGPAFYKIPGSSLVAVMRRNAEKAKDFAFRHGVKKWYTHANDLINDPEVNAIYVATPPDTHLLYSIASMKVGKPVYVEKPMSLDVSSCEQMLQTSIETGVKLAVAHYRRFVPMFMHIHKLIRDGLIGEIRNIKLSLFLSQDSFNLSDPRIQWRVNPDIGGVGGHFYDLAPHQLDLIIHWFGKPLEYYGMSANQTGMYAAREVVGGIAIFEKNILFTGNWCFTADKSLEEDTCIIAGSKGYIRFSFFGHQIEVSINGKQEKTDFNHPPHIQQPMIEQVCQYFSGFATNPCSAEDAMISMQMMESFTQITNDRYIQ